MKYGMKDYRKALHFVHIILRLVSKKLKPWVAVTNKAVFMHRTLFIVNLLNNGCPGVVLLPWAVNDVLLD